MFSSLQGLGFYVLFFFSSSVELNKEKNGTIRLFLKFVWKFSLKLQNLIEAAISTTNNEIIFKRN